MNSTGVPADALTAQELPAPSFASPPGASRIIHGRLIPPQQQILLYSSDEWEAFIEEWAHHQKTIYMKVVRLSGANDMGIDVAGFTDDAGFEGVWDNYQCKHYDNALAPTTAVPEIAKILWHSFNKQFAPPRKYYFMAPKNCGMKLRRLLQNPSKLLEHVIAEWDKLCSTAITSKQTIKLEGDFLAYVQAFDHSIFTFRPTLEVLDEHRQTPYFAPRFGGGLPDRPPSSTPPVTPSAQESRYLQQLLGAYGHCKSMSITNVAALKPWPELTGHYHRQREFFYHAESLRNFARDNVPPGTFEELQDEVYAGVADIAASPHADALTRLNATTQAAAQLAMNSNALIHVTKVQDKRGICHQLANEDRLLWVTS